MNTIELRSDTFTLPDEPMREAIARAPLGDDVFGEDPTVNALQDRAAQLTGKEAALFVPSGSQANLISLLTHCQRGDEFIVGDSAHIFVYEAGSSAAVGGLHPHTLPNHPDGTLDLERIEAAIRPDDSHFPRTRLLCLENTHNRCWGSPIGLGYLDAVGALCEKRGLKLHLDGARIFNAAEAEGVKVRDLAATADSLSFCLSKGLGAPVGSLICGCKEFIKRAHRLRKQLGGGMRQAGVLAAAGLYALDHRVERLADDHAMAKRLAEGIVAIEGLSTEPARVRTNIVYFDITRKGLTAEELVLRCKQRGLLFLGEKGRRLRMVTHFGLSMADMDRALALLAEAVAED